MAKDTFTKIDELADELGTAASHRRVLVQEITDLADELAALDQLAEDASDREEFDNVITQRKEAELDLRFARNKLSLFDRAPRVSREQLEDLLAQLSAEADIAAKSYRKKIEKPLAEIVTAGDEFDQHIDAIRGAVRKLASVNGPVTETDKTLRRLFSRFELGELRTRAYMDGTIVYPGLRDALRLSSTAKQAPFDTH